MREIGVYVFAHTRSLLLADTLESLKRQNASQYVDVWIDGYQGIEELQSKVLLTQHVADQFEVGARNYHRGQLGFRKLILLAMQQSVQKYKYLIFLEDDCFPTRDAIDIFVNELKAVEDNEDVFSVYGHPFLMAEETGYCTRFQGWGWATTSKKLRPYVDKLIDCYSMYEKDYLDYVDTVLTTDVQQRLDVTPPRQPTYTLRSFFAWDETLALLTALDQKLHKRTDKRIIYNCGIGEGSSRFADMDKFMKPPFNLVFHKDVWKYY